MWNSDRRSPAPAWRGLGLALGLGWGLAAAARGAASEPDPLRWARPAMQIYTSREGLPENAAMGLAKDAQGRLYVATQDGAACFDGRRWRQVELPDNNISAFLRSVLRGPDGSLWFARQDGGASQLHPDGRWESHAQGLGPAGSRVNVLLASGATICAGTEEAGLGVYDGRHWSFIGPAQGLPAANVQQLAKAAAGGVWVGGPKGLLRAGEGRVLERALEGQPIGAILESPDAEGRDTLWAGGQRGLQCRREGQWHPIPLPPELRGHNLTQLLTMRDGRGAWQLWVGSDGGGLGCWDGAAWRVLSTGQGLPSNSIWSLLPEEGRGASRSLWVGTDAGLVRLDFGQWSSFGKEQGLSDPSVYSMVLMKKGPLAGTLWMGTRSGLVEMKEGGPRIWTPKEGLPTDTVFGLLEWPEGEGSLLVAGTQGGLAVFRDGRWRAPDSEPVELKSANVRRLDLGTDEQGAPAIWIASGNRGLWRWDGRRTWKHWGPAEGVPTQELHCDLQTSDGALWIGTQGSGLLRVGPEGAKAYTTATGFPNNSVICLHESDWKGRRILWAGTEGAGLAWTELGQGEPVWHLLSDRSEPALPDTTVYRVEEDSEKRLYIFTNRGAARLTADGKGFRAEFISSDCGLPSSEFNGGASMVDAEGRIWAGTLEGAVVFDPRLEAAPEGKPPLFFEHLLVNGQEGLLAPWGSLGHRQNNVQFEFNLLSFFRASETRYQTQLMGLEERPSPWSPEPRREFPSLPPGHFTFRVWARDYAGRIVGPLDLSFERRRAPWATPWAYAAYALALAAAVGLLVRQRLRILERRNQELEAKVEERTREIAAQKDHIEEQNRQIARLMESGGLAQQDLASWAQGIVEELARSIGAQSIGVCVVNGDELRSLGELSGSRLPSMAELQARPWLDPARDRRHTPVPAPPGRERRREQVVPVRGPSGEVLGGLVLAGQVSWGEGDRRLINVVAAQLGAVLELHKTRKTLQVARARQAETRQAMRDRGVELMQSCPKCRRCFDESLRTCPYDLSELESHRVLPLVMAERYRLQRMLGEGGMGIVFEALDERLGRPVALKLIKPELYAIPEVQARFQQEARSLARIEHPHVIAIHDSGELEDGSAFLVMELLRGADLGTVLRRFGPGTGPQVARLLRQAGAALGAAHRSGIVHRDVKPENLFMVPAPEGFAVKVLDFGLAKPLAAEAGLTHTGMVVGTPHYMSPEQVRCRNLDPRSDVYALAANGYEALTGRRLIRPGAVADVFTAIVQGQHLDLDSQIHGLPYPVLKAFDAALSVDPAGRPMDIEAWVDSFAGALEGARLEAEGWAPIGPEGLPDGEDHDNSRTNLGWKK